MTQVCLPAGCIDAIRVSRVDDCTDLAVPGASTGYIFNCFRNLDLTTNIEEGQKNIVRNDCGRKCLTTRKCDELENLGLAFELLNPDYELFSLLTGQTLINDGSENIGWFHTDGSNCAPFLCVELFEQVPQEVCSPSHRYRRIVLPKVQFKPVPRNQREGQLRVVGIEGSSSPASVAAWATGPFADSPFDFSAIPEGISTHIMEFFDSTVTETLEGTCGFIEVPEPVPPTVMRIDSGASDAPLTVCLTGEYLQNDPLGTLYFIRLVYGPGPGQYDDIYLDAPGNAGNPPDLVVTGSTDTGICLYSQQFAGRTYTAVVIADADFETGGQYDISVAVDPVPFEVNDAFWHRPDHTMHIELSAAVAATVTLVEFTGLDLNGDPIDGSDSVSINAFDASTVSMNTDTTEFYTSFVLKDADGEVVALWTGSAQVGLLDVTYDDGLDRLLIVASLPFLLDGTGDMRFTATINGVSSSNITSPDVVLDDATHAHIDGWDAVAATFPPPGPEWNLTFIRLNDDTLDFFSIWRGSISGP